MNVTGAEAKEKWCHAAVASHTNPRGGFDTDDGANTRKTFPCIGSACMAWRSAGNFQPVYVTGDDLVKKWEIAGYAKEGEPATVNDQGGGERLAQKMVKPAHLMTGYCGLAG